MPPQRRAWGPRQAGAQQTPRPGCSTAAGRTARVRRAACPAAALAPARPPPERHRKPGRQVRGRAARALNPPTCAARGAARTLAGLEQWSPRLRGRRALRPLSPAQQHVRAILESTHSYSMVARAERACSSPTLERRYSLLQRRSAGQSAIASVSTSGLLRDTKRWWTCRGVMPRALRRGTAVPTSSSGPSARSLTFDALTGGADYIMILCRHRLSVLRGRHDLQQQDQGWHAPRSSSAVSFRSCRSRCCSGVIKL